MTMRERPSQPAARLLLLHSTAGATGRRLFPCPVARHHQSQRSNRVGLPAGFLSQPAVLSPQAALPDRGRSAIARSGICIYVILTSTSFLPPALSAPEPRNAAP
jgi:hypothetical protein